MLLGFVGKRREQSRKNEGIEHVSLKFPRETFNPAERERYYDKMGSENIAFHNLDPSLIISLTIGGVVLLIKYTVLSSYSNALRDKYPSSKKRNRALRISTIVGL